MEKLKYFLSNNKYNLGLLIVWLIICCITMNNHELWRDEAQVWCIVRDMNFIEILKTIRIEGHPPLWYLLLMPFAKSGFSVVSMQIISLLLVLSGVIVLIFTASFNKFFKTVIVLSSGMLYFLPVVARNYSLIPVLIFLFANLYPKRLENPFKYIILLMLLSYTHALMFGFCGILFLLFSYEKIKEYRTDKNIKILYPVIILLINFIVLFFAFCNIQGANYAVENSGIKHFIFLELFKNYCSVFFPVLFGNFIIFDCIIFYSCLALILFSFFKSDKKCFLIFFVSLLYHFFVYAEIWFGGVSYQKGFVLYLILIFCLQIYAKENKTYKFTYYPVLVLFIISVIFSPVVVLGDIGYNFSGGKQTADFIKKNLDDENIFIVMGYPFTFSSVSAYLPGKKLYSSVQNCYISYFNFKINGNNKKEIYPKNAKYFIVQEDFVMPENSGLEEIFASNRENLSTQKEKEIFRIYKKE